MMKAVLVLLFSFSIISCVHEKGEEVNYSVIENYIQINGNQILNEIDNTVIPFSRQGYTLHLPGSEPIATIIFPSGSALDTTRNIDEFDIIEPALAKDMAVLFVSTGKVIEFLFTDEDIKIIDTLIGSALENYGLINKPIFLAGMSLGGTMAMRYSEYCFLNRSSFGIKPKAIAICDAPLDMLRMWHEQEQSIVNNYHPNAVGEAKWVLHFLRTNLGGSPEESIQTYIDYSPFVYKNENKNKTALFKNTPIRMYHEPDINWWIENRAKDYNTINSIDLAGFCNSLRLTGNNEVELITTYQKRKDYEKDPSPHTWTIVDSEELVVWFLGKMYYR